MSFAMAAALNDELRMARAEIERLRIGIRDHAGVELSEENDRLIDEIKRLRAAITNCSGSCGSALGDEQTADQEKKA